MQRVFLGCLLSLTLLLPAARAQSRFEGAVQARLEKSYATVVFADGRKQMVPLAALSDGERAELIALATSHPLAAGRSHVVVVKDTTPLKKTIVTQTKDGPLETVQLCSPALLRDQVGATCMLYARVHWLDIAGYPVNTAAIYKVMGNAPSDAPWKDPHYLSGLTALLTGFTPSPRYHYLPGSATDPFAWTRDELRQGRPVLAAFPKETWQALPPGFIAQHPWGGGSVGHQVVVNGFVWNEATQRGTFHIVNSWAELPEFDLKTEAAQGGVLIIEQSVSPRGETTPDSVRETVKSVTLLRAVGRTNLYEVETNLGRRRVAAASEADARALVEKP